MSTSNLRNLLAGLVSQFQPLEQAFAQLLLERSVNNAVGAQLDAIGKIVGQPRAGLADDAYRQFVRARIAANRSSGLVNDILRVIVLVVFDPAANLQYIPQHPAAFVLRVNQVAVSDVVADIAAQFLRDIVASGVRAVLEYSPSAPASTLRLALSNGTEPGNGAVDLSTSPTDSAQIARAIKRS
jgi:hypothetical protein